MDSVSLEQVIRQYIQLDPPNAKGWFPVLCKVCNDHGKKGKRAAFLFSGTACSYHCFNCGHTAGYDSVKHEKIPKKMIQVLESFQIPDDQVNHVLFNSLASRIANGGIASEQKIKLDIEPTTIPLPKHFYPLANASPNDKWAEIAKYYLDEERGIDYTKYPFMLAHKTGNSFLDRWFQRVIIPIYKDNKLIFYIGRDLTAKHAQKYLSPDFSKENVIYGFDRLFEKSDTPLYIVEGWFDAFMIDGVAILGNEISEAHTIWLNKSHREKIYIPDKRGNGRMAAEQALKNNWSVSTPDIGTDAKDINDAVKKYGRLYVMKSIADQTTADDFTAKSRLGVYCEYEKAYKNSSKKKDPKTS